MADSHTGTGEAPCRQLHMVWPSAEQWAFVPPVDLPQGYEIRLFEAGDEVAYLELMNKVKLGDFDHDKLEAVRKTILPGGFFVVIHNARVRLVAATMAHHRPTELHPDGGEVGWVAADPDHSGKGLGMATVAAAVGRLMRAGYQRIYLSTDDFRLPAIKTYLKLGFIPLMYTDGMQERWQAVFDKLGRGRKTEDRK